MQILGLDFETASLVDVTEVGSVAYAQHPSTRIRCAVFGYSVGGNDVADADVWFPGQPVPARAVQHLRAGGLVVAHNATFEASMLAHVADLRDVPPVKTEQWIDTAKIAAAYALPTKLEGLAKVIGAPVQKDMEGHALMRKLADARYVPTQAELDRLAAYCRDDVLAMLHVYWRLPPLPAVEWTVLREDARINTRGVAIDLDLVHAMRDLADRRAEELSQEIFEATNAAVHKPTNVGALKEWIGEHGVPVPQVVRVVAKKRATKESLDAAAIDGLLQDPDLPTPVRTVLAARREHGKTTSLAKLDRVAVSLGADRRLRYALEYCGAHTGRWASRGIQLHNLPKLPKALKKRAEELRSAILRRDYDAVRAVHPDVLAALSYSLRSILVPAPGHDFIGADYSAIEARVIAWLAGQQDVLDVFARGEDIYVRDAAAVGSDNRQLGKTLRLGLGYGMGARRFLDTAQKDGVPLPPKDARRFVKLWREANPAIVQFWEDLQTGFADALLHRGKTFSAGLVSIVAGAQCLRIFLPSGRALHYWRPEIGAPVTKRIETIAEDGTTVVSEFTVQPLRFYRSGKDKNSMEVEDTYGGALAENVTQAVARDVLAHAVSVTLAGSPYTVVGHVHDSIVAEVPEGFGIVAEFEKLICNLPAWARGLPLKAEGYRAKWFHG